MELFVHSDSEFSLFLHYFFPIFSLYFSGRFSTLKPDNPELNKGKHLVQAWGNVLVTSGYTDRANKYSEKLV